MASSDSAADPVVAAAAAPPAPAPTSNKRRPSNSSPEESSAAKRARDVTADDEDDILADDPSSAANTAIPAAPAEAKMDGEDVKMTDESATAEGAAAPAANSVPPAPAAGDAPAQQIQMRCLIVTQDASVIIGKAGKHVNEIRDKSGARVTVSESIPGNPERILHVSGALDAVSKAFGLIVRRINDEPFDVASVPGSRAVTIKFIIPNSRMGTVIGKGGSKIKEIQEASGARLNASEAMLPGSTERVLSVSGVADAVHIAVYYIGNILIEYQDRPGSRDAGPSAAGGATYRQGGGGGRDSYRGDERGERRFDDRRPGGGGGGGGAYGGAPGGAPVHLSAPGVQTQQIFIPNDLVGSIIGKAGAKINEIRTQSSTQIKIMEPDAPGATTAANERLVTITGSATGINTAIQLLYQRLEIEKANRAAALGSA